jgi:hypothetical protein
MAKVGMEYLAVDSFRCVVIRLVVCRSAGRPSTKHSSSSIIGGKMFSIHCMMISVTSCGMNSYTEKKRIFRPRLRLYFCSTNNPEDVFPDDQWPQK